MRVLSIACTYDCDIVYKQLPYDHGMQADCFMGASLAGLLPCSSNSSAAVLRCPGLSYKVGFLMLLVSAIC